MKKKEIIQNISLSDPSPEVPPAAEPSALSVAAPEEPRSAPKQANGSVGMRILGHFVLGILLGAAELALSFYTKLLDWPVVFIGLLFILFCLVGVISLRRKGNAPYLLVSIVTYALVVMGAYIYHQLIALRVDLVPWNVFAYFLLYVWPAILAVLSVALWRVLLSPSPPRSLAPLRRQMKLHRRVQQRVEQVTPGPGSARSLRLERELRRRMARRNGKK